MKVFINGRYYDLEQIKRAKKPVEKSTEFDPKLIAQMMVDKKLRRKIVYESHEWFFTIYFPEYITYKTAPFQKEIFQLTQDQNCKLNVVVAFRGSGKTTIIANSLPIWAVIGKLQKKYILLLYKTQEGARRTLKNIKEELENNELLRGDLGPFQEEPITDWNAVSILIPKYKARITVASMEQSIRGTKHGAHRPDLIILDDVEDLDSVRSRESRDKLYQSFTGDIVPLGDKSTQIFIIGNLLHEDSLVMRLKEGVESERLDGIYKQYPLLNEDGEILWPGKYSTPQDIEIEKRKLGDNIAWHREFLLKILPSEHQIIDRERIHYYDSLPHITDKTYESYYIVTGIDLAISLKETADYTAMVTAHVYRHHAESQWYIYILPYPINEHLEFSEILNTAERIAKFNPSRCGTRTVIESVAFQAAVPQELKRRLLGRVKEFIPHGDKHSRLTSISHMIHEGYVRFPKKGCEKLIAQLVGFGVERHDDLVDGLIMVVYEVLNTPSYSHFTSEAKTTKEQEREEAFQRMKRYNPHIRRGTLQEDMRKQKEGTIAGNLWDMKF